MVHALQEAHRVLKPNGILIDLRPAGEHRRVGVGAGRSWKFVASMRENLADDHAANMAVAEVIRTGLFRHAGQRDFNLDRVMDTLVDLRAYIDEFSRLGKKLPSHEWLVRRVRSALPPRTKITSRGPLTLNTLRKL